NPTTMPLSTRRPNKPLTLKLTHLLTPLAPLYALPNGSPHPSFPTTLLAYHLLTESQIDAMASWYHQTSPTHRYNSQYPSNMRWDKAFLAKPDPSTMSEEEMGSLLSDKERVDVKRRMVGKFIGLRGCETPIEEVGRRIKFLEDRLERSIRLERE
ncbi:hypothetical protein EJ08DRAFT_568177, partial [Tothia fuscella]